MITKHLFILFLFITSHHQHLPERLEYQTSNHLRNIPTTNSMNKLQTTKHKLLPLAQSRAHMHRQEDNSHPASQRMVTRKTNKRKRKENLNKSVCIFISARRIPHAPASIMHGRTHLLLSLLVSNFSRRRGRFRGWAAAHLRNPSVPRPKRPALPNQSASFGCDRSRSLTTCSRLA